MLFHSELIFVSIASYRDPQLVPTVLDCIAKASHPHRLRFGICWQRDAADAPLPFASDPRFQLIDVNWRDSKGACWARAETMKLWQGEHWFLQIDSHCRFANGWDDTLLCMAAQTGSPKPIVSTYPPPFTPGPNETLTGGPLQMVFQQFTPEGVPQLRPAAFLREHSLARPLRARFLAAGFLFAPGEFVRDVPYDPELYFMGEESSITVRAFTAGYDLFHPAEAVVWHNYIRSDEPKHWDDHQEEKPGAKPWNTLDEVSRDKVKRLLAGERVSPFGLGAVRTLKNYEEYAGISFRHKKVQAYTMRGGEPPNPNAPADWTEKICTWMAVIRFTREQAPAGALADSRQWSLSIFDDSGNEISHRDVQQQEIAQLSRSESSLAIVCEFASETPPSTWSLWPLTNSGQWLPRFTGKFADADFSIVTDSPD
jgi:UDP-N-acetylglucosamine (GlcNAc):hydroxyproline polypeptide GlcNAc-transferase